MKLLLILVLFFSYCGISFSQNFQTIKSTDINYFGTPTLDYVLATRTDSIALAGSDSIFYSYKTVRENDTATVSGCDFIVGQNWFGSKVIIKSNGENQFLNKYNDTITIQTQALLNDTFLVYTYPSGDSLFGWVSSIDEMTILGNLDSVKTIDLFTNQPLTISNPRFQIGKESGFIEVLPFYSFPEPYGTVYTGSVLTDGSYELVGTEYPRIGITKPRVGDIYDFDIGDRIVISTNTGMTAPGSWTTYYRERDVVGKTVWGLDSVTYEFQDTSKYVQGYDSFIISTDYYGGVNTFTYYDLDEWYSSFLPEEFDTIVNDNWNSLFVNNCNQLEELKYSTAVWQEDPLDPCMVFGGLSWYSINARAIVGLGNFLPFGYTNPGFNDYTGSNLLYFYKIDGGDECGTNSYLNNDVVLRQNKAVSLFPNPSSSQVNIQMNVENQSDFDLVITDLSGKVVLNETVSASALTQGYVFDISQFEKGIYFVNLSNGSELYIQKLVKN